MDKDSRVGRHGSHRVQLALCARHIPRMDRRGHRVFQRGVQVPLPDSLFSRGVRHHPVHPEFSSLLKSGPGTALADKCRHSMTTGATACGCPVFYFHRQSFSGKARELTSHIPQYAAFIMRTTEMSLTNMKTAGKDASVPTARKGKRQKRKTQTLAPDKLQGKVGKCFLSDGKVRPQAVSGKIILAGGSGIFPENLAFPEAFAAGPS